MPFLINNKSTSPILGRPSGSFLQPSSKVLKLTAPVADVTPDPVNWNNPSGIGELITNTQTITGISTDITLAINIWQLGDAAFGDIYFSKNSGAYQLINYPTGTTVIMTNNDTLSFKAVQSGGTNGASDYIFVINQSDNNTQLDEIIFTVNTGE